MIGRDGLLVLVEDEQQWRYLSCEKPVFCPFSDVSESQIAWFDESPTSFVVVLYHTVSFPRGFSQGNQ